MPGPKLKKYVKGPADPSWEGRGAGGGKVLSGDIWDLHLAVERGEQRPPH